MDRQPKSITVAELRTVLNEFPDDALVMYATPSRDYWGRTLAKGIDKYEIDRTTIVWSEYHRAWKITEEIPDTEEATAEVVVLGS